jgi:regulator of protease activity HflC (stomatin/prohibitin superfamily)
MFWKNISVPFRTVGFLLKDNIISEQLDAGVYDRWVGLSKTNLLLIPLTSRSERVINQEVLSIDNIAFRFSFSVTFTITNPRKYVEAFGMESPFASKLDQKVTLACQVVLRDHISKLKSEEISEKRNSLLEGTLPIINSRIEDIGVVVSEVQLVDLSFPKNIQDLFAKVLEAKLRSQADLENARSTVASARALKNASELMKDDDSIRFHQFLEALTKIASKGNHTFMIGEMPTLSQPKSKH